MQPINTLKHNEIQRALREGKWIAGVILRSLGVTNKADIQDIYRRIINELQKMKFKIIYNRDLCNAHGNQGVSSFAKYANSNRTNGGIIYINPDCSIKEQIECIIHEYVHIKYYSLPISTTDIGIFKDKAIIYKLLLSPDKQVEKYKEIYNIIFDDLKNMNFVFIIKDFTDPEIPAYTEFNSTNKIDGGTIMLNSRLSTNEKLEAICREYVGIVDCSLPIYEMNEIIPDFKVMVDESYQRKVELYIDVCTYTLMMPQEILKQSLLENDYNIDAILKQFDHYMQTDVLLQWITINTGIRIHFAWIMIQKDNNNNIVRWKIHDNCNYDPPVDPKAFSIEAVLNNANSAAAQSMKSRKPESRYSNIDGKDYYCYAYYEADQSQILRNDSIPGSVIIIYDRLLVIGWEKAIYDTMRHLTKMFKEFQRH
jgi:hypothetical protein